MYVDPHTWNTHTHTGDVHRENLSGCVLTEVKSWFGQIKRKENPGLVVFWQSFTKHPSQDTQTTTGQTPVDIPTWQPLGQLSLLFNQKCGVFNSGP